MGTSQESGVKGEKEGEATPATDAKHINLKVTGQDGTVVHFKIKKNTALRKLMNAYCDRANVNKNSVRFVLNGQPVHDDDTPLGLDMEEDDTIEVFGEQVGGGVGLRGSSSGVAATLPLTSRRRPPEQ